MPAEQVKLMIFDVDGVLTDGTLLVSEGGVDAKPFNVKDGLGIALLKKAHIEVAFVSGRKSPSVDFRARELHVKWVVQGADNKLETVRDIMVKAGVREDETGYCGDDLNDLPVIRRVGFSACPADAAPEVQKVVDFVAKNKGGHGCAREIAERVLKAQQRWGGLVEAYLT